MKDLVPFSRGLVYLANASDGLFSGGASLELLKMLGIPSVASFQKAKKTAAKSDPLKLEFELHKHWSFETICVC